MRPAGRWSEILPGPLGFGAAALGNLYSAVDDESAHQTVDAAWDRGVRYFDTAPHYGLGLSERRLGAALAGRPREKFMISTKVGRLLRPNSRPGGSDLAFGFDVPDTLVRQVDYSRDGVLRSIEDSLERLGLDRVDVVYVHDPEKHLDEAIEQALPTLVALRDQGVVGAIGAGMNFVAPLQRIVRECDVDVVMVAGRWTLLDRSAAPLLDACFNRQVAVVAAAPFNSGLLASPRPTEDSPFDYGVAPSDVLQRARAVAHLCQEHSVALPQAALQFPQRHPAVACVVAGMRSAAEVVQDVDLMAQPVPAAFWRALDEDRI